MPLEPVDSEPLALLEPEFVLPLEAWPEFEPLEVELPLLLVELEFPDPEFVSLEFAPDSAAEEEPGLSCDEPCWEVWAEPFFSSLL